MPIAARARRHADYITSHFSAPIYIYSTNIFCSARPYRFPATKYISLRTSQANGHIRRDTEDIVLDPQISRMDDIALAYPNLKLFLEPQQGFSWH